MLSRREPKFPNLLKMNAVKLIHADDQGWPTSLLLPNMRVPHFSRFLREVGIGIEAWSAFDFQSSFAAAGFLPDLAATPAAC